MNDLMQTVDDAQDEISLLDLLQVVMDNLRLLVLGPLAVAVVALGVGFVMPSIYTAKTTFLPPKQQESAAGSLFASLGSLGGLAGAAGLKSPGEQYVSYLKSASLQNALIMRFELKTRYKAKLMRDARMALLGKTVIVAGKDGLISVEVDDQDPQFAADLANAYVQELNELRGRLIVTEAQERRAFFEKQLNKAKENLIRAETALKASGVSGSTLKSSPLTALSEIAAIKAQITAQEVKLGAMRGYLAESAPDFKQALTELKSLRNYLAKQEQDTPEPAQQSDYITRYRDFKYHETLYELFAKQYELARVDEAREGVAIQVLDVAEPPESKSKPKRGLMAVIAGLAAGFALLLFVFVRHALRNARADQETASKLAAIRAAWFKALGRPDPRTAN